MESIPDFIGIGASKAATTWIFLCLKEHPEICVSSKKEIKFFCKPYNYRRGVAYYLSFFKKCPKGKIKGEFTSAYINSPQVPFLIHKLFPNIKIIACLRNPIEKIYSSYKFQKIMKLGLNIHKTFEDAFLKHNLLKNSGHYYKQLRDYFSLFPKENILVVFYEEIEENPVEILKKIYRFLGVENFDFIPSLAFKKKNITGTRMGKYKIPLVNSICYKFFFRFRTDGRLKKIIRRIRLDMLIETFIQRNIKFVPASEEYKKRISNFSINNATQNYLYQIFIKDIEQLEKLLNKDLSFWKN